MMEIVHWLCIGAGTVVVAIAWLLRRNPIDRVAGRAKECSTTTGRGTAFARLSTIR